MLRNFKPNTAGLTLAPLLKCGQRFINGAIQLGMGALASFAVGVFVKDSMIPMVVIMTTTTLAAFYFTDWEKNIKKLLQLLKNKMQ
jgi:DHA1 family bicyclomycin/chloramphenicol resistance-like MFS transporter